MPTVMFDAICISFCGQGFETIHYIRQCHCRGRPLCLPWIGAFQCIRATTGGRPYNIRQCHCRGRPLCLPWIGAFQCIRATTGGRPYKNHDFMDVIGHNDEFIDFNTRIIFENFIPYGLNHAPGIIQHHFPIHDFAEKACPVLGANGDEICPGFGIIVPLQANGSAVLFFGIVFYSNISSPLISSDNQRTNFVIFLASKPSIPAIHRVCGKNRFQTNAR